MSEKQTTIIREAELAGNTVHIGSSGLGYESKTCMHCFNEWISEELDCPMRYRSAITFVSTLVRRAERGAVGVYAVIVTGNNGTTLSVDEFQYDVADDELMVLAAVHAMAVVRHAWRTEVSYPTVPALLIPMHGDNSRSWQVTDHPRKLTEGPDVCFSTVMEISKYGNYPK